MIWRWYLYLTNVLYYTFKFVLFLYAVILQSVKKIILYISLFFSLGLVILIAVLMLMLIQKLFPLRNIFWRLDELFSLCIYALNWFFSVLWISRFSTLYIHMCTCRYAQYHSWKEMLYYSDHCSAFVLTRSFSAVDWTCSRFAFKFCVTSSYI